MKGISRLVLCGGAAAMMFAVGAGAANATPNALACGALVTQSTRLTADLADCPGSALVVGAPGITIDLDGHTLDGVGVAPGIDNNGAHDNVTIRRGTIKEFAQGIDAIEASGLVIRDVVLEGNLIGITLGRTQGTLIQRVTARDNSFAGIEGFQTENLVVRASTITGHDHGGVVDRASYGSRFERNVFSGNEFYGLLIDNSRGAVVRGNIAEANAYDGFQLGFRTRDAVIVDNTASNNGANGIAIDEPGNLLRRNTAFDNGEVGIAAVAGTIDGGGNRAFDNAGGDCVELVCRS